ncbi:MAG: thiamine phosphate synthase [Alkalibacterium sp.]|nr:thiamine phosphate synthase [Alkalibacterium sp.]
MAIGADGVHVGQEDLTIEETVQLAGEDMFVGLSVNSFEQFLTAEKLEGVDYIGVGPVYSTSSKVDAKKIIGLELLKKTAARKTRKPIVAIGGISEDRAILVRQTGVNGNCGDFCYNKKYRISNRQSPC